MPTDDIDDALASNATGPKRARGDSSEVEQHSLPDLIAYDRYKNDKAASRRRGLGIKMSRLVPPGAQ